MSVSIKLSSDLIDAARAEKALFDRSIGKQVEHWANIGKAFEAIPETNMHRIRDVLCGRFDAANLSDKEAAIFVCLLEDALGDLVAI